MMPTPGVKARVERFYRALEKLKKLGEKRLEEFISDGDAVDIGERNLHVAIEAIIDVGGFLISRAGFRIPKLYRDIARILYENRILDGNDYKLLDRLVTIRNILVHNYVMLEAETLHKYISRYEDIRRLMANILKYLEEKGFDP